MPFSIVRNDITKMNTDAIVNAANTNLAMGSGVCGAIFKAAGAKELQDACDKLSPIKTGEAVITPSFNLNVKCIIHTAGPVYRDGKQGEVELLRSCYINSLNLALYNKCKSISFPLISSGIYRFPKEQALQIATTAISDFLETHELDVYLMVFDKSAFSISRKLIGEINSFIDDNYVEERAKYSRSRELLDIEKSVLFDAKVDEISAPIMLSEAILKADLCLDDIVGKLDEPFSATLLRLIDAKGKTDVDVYKKANIDRKLFSKIRTGKGYMPSKRTAVALAVALELSISETNDLLGRAGFTLSRSQKFDVIIEYFILNGKFDVFEINEVLFYYDQPLLGG